MRDANGSIDGEILAQQVHAIVRLTVPMMLACIFNATASLFVLFVSDQVTLIAIAWGLVCVIVSGLGLHNWYKKRHKTFPRTVGPSTRNKAVRSAAFLGLVWAFPGIAILPNVSGAAEGFFIALAAGIVAGGAIALYPLPRAAFVYCSLVAGINLFGFMGTDQPEFLGFATVTVMFLVVVMSGIMRHQEIFVSEFRNRLLLAEKTREVEELLEQSRSEATEQKIESERRLMQAQKMEAVGQLTGGIAHDFNNLLAAVQGNAELLKLEGADEELADPIIASCQRGAELTRRLLAFARQQNLSPIAVDLRELVDNMGQLLERTLSENISIKLEFDEPLWPILVDPGPLENAILNLALNARDAMPDGGILRVACKNAPSLSDDSFSGTDYVTIEITDNGKGMTSEEVARATDPFFTTKEFGQGSGLGLSMVYGFVEQSEGLMKISSLPKGGTTVTLQLPVSPNEPIAKPDPRPGTIPMGDGRPILLIEDNPAVQKTLTSVLKSLDYDVVSAGSVEQARGVLGTRLAPNLVLSDVVLPGGTNGLEFADELAKRRPEITCLLMSGHVERMPDGMTQDAQPFILKKPFDRSSLAIALEAASLVVD